MSFVNHASKMPSNTSMKMPKLKSAFENMLPKFTPSGFFRNHTISKPNTSLDRSRSNVPSD
jgi:hypothetical protein